MTQTLRLSLKSGEHIFINGAHLRVDRRVSLELLNEAEFLLSQHVVDAEETTTPLRQLYFVIQTMLTRPEHRAVNDALYRQTMIALSQVTATDTGLKGLIKVDAFVQEGKLYDALKHLRSLIKIEDAAARARDGASGVAVTVGDA